MSLAEPPAPIRVLPSHLIDRIAAGEVVERPASVVKELVENSVDAGASHIEVATEGGGLTRIVVSDDGHGIAHDEVALALARHATSKLACAQDLDAIATLGFRGEALSSIASVSRLSVTTRAPTSDHGTRVQAEAGDVERVEITGAPPGTSVDVRDLFFNTPARRKFLRSPPTEQAHAVEAALRVVVGARRGGLVVTAGQRRLVDLPAGASLEALARAAVAGGERRLYPFDATHQGVRVSGSVARPEEGRGDPRGLWFFVNGRFVRDRMLQRALFDAYRTLLERGRYPVGVVYVDLDPARVDVNVHPQKLEVRFSDPEVVFRAVSATLTSLLASSPWLSLGAGERILSTSLAVASRVAELAGPAYGVPHAHHATSEHPELHERGRFASLRPLGQAWGLLLVCEDADGLVLIDQHAAHERVVFERLRAQLGQGGVVRQTLLFPEVVDLPASQVALVERAAQDLAALGVELSLAGPEQARVHAIPAALGGVDARRLVADLLAAWADGGEVFRADFQLDLLSRAACHAAVRAGDALSEAEIRSLLVALDEIDFAGNCPHGRPVWHRFSRAELVALFHR